MIVDSLGHLGTINSSARYKDNIQPMDKASEAILSLQPVIFRYKHELDPVGIPQFGLVAEQVRKVNPDLVARDDRGKPYTVRYEAVNAMLLNEFLKEHQKVEKLGAKMTRQRGTSVLPGYHAPGAARTRNLQLRRLSLYPVELRAQWSRSINCASCLTTGLGSRGRVLLSGSVKWGEPAK